MTRFLVPQEIYKERISICKSCDYYFKLTGSCKVCGCFMRIKSRIATQSCPKGYWEKTTEIEPMVEGLETEGKKHLEQELIAIYPDFKDGKAKDIETKTKMIEIYNAYFGGGYKTTTNCASCLHTVYNSLKYLYDKITREKF